MTNNNSNDNNHHHNNNNNDNTNNNYNNNNNNNNNNNISDNEVTQKERQKSLKWMMRGGKRLKVHYGSEQPDSETSKFSLSYEFENEWVSEQASE